MEPEAVLSETFEKTRRLRGIRGWLLVFVMFIAYVSLEFALGAGPDTFYSVVSLPLSVYGAYTVFLLATKRPRAPVTARMWLGAMVAAVSVVFVNDYLRYGVVHDALIWNALLALIGLAYLSRAKRITETYGGLHSPLALSHEMHHAFNEGQRLVGIRGWLLVFVLLIGLFALDLLTMALSGYRLNSTLVILFLVLAMYGGYVTVLLIMKHPRARGHARVWRCRLDFPVSGGHCRDKRIRQADGMLNHIVLQSLRPHPFAVSNISRAQKEAAIREPTPRKAHELQVSMAVP